MKCPIRAVADNFATGNPFTALVHFCGIRKHGFTVVQLNDIKAIMWLFCGVHVIEADSYSCSNCRLAEVVFPLYKISFVCLECNNVYYILKQKLFITFKSAQIVYILA